MVPAQLYPSGAAGQILTLNEAFWNILEHSGVGRNCCSLERARAKGSSGVFLVVWRGEFQTLCEPQFPCLHSGHSVIPAMPLTGAGWEDGWGTGG